MNLGKISVIGGTGDIGEALVKRFSLQNEVVIGSRDPTKAQDCAQKFSQEVLQSTGKSVQITGAGNTEAASAAEYVILAVPHAFALATAELISPHLSPSSILISPVVPMAKTSQGFVYVPVTSESGSESMAMALSRIVKVPVVAAFHTLPASRLGDVAVTPNFDVLICADSTSALERVADLVKNAPNLRALTVGGLAMAQVVESLTPLILNVAIRNKLRNLSLKFI